MAIMNETYMLKQEQLKMKSTITQDDVNSAWDSDSQETFIQIYNEFIK